MPARYGRVHVFPDAIEFPSPLFTNIISPALYRKNIFTFPRHAPKVRGNRLFYTR